MLGAIAFVLVSGLLLPNSAGVRAEASHPCANSFIYPSRYIPSPHVETMQQVAVEHNLVIMMLPPNPAAQIYHGRRGYRSKPQELKPCRSAPEGSPVAGLVQCPELSDADRQLLKRLGFHVLDAEHHYLVTNDQADFYYSD